MEEVGREHPHLPASLEAHQEHFGRAPELLAADRGFYSAENEKTAQQAGVKRVVLPKNGKPSEKRKRHEKQRWFKRGFRFRAGIEGRISVLRVAPSASIAALIMEKKGWAGGLAGVLWRTT
jgi:IS5 family transposase